MESFEQYHEAPEPEDAPGPERLLLDPASREAVYNGAEIYLTRKEFALLELLQSAEGKVVTREEIIERIWGAEFTPASNVVDAKVKRLRRKLGDRAGELIETVRGVGYRLNRPLSTGERNGQPMV